MTYIPSAQIAAERLAAGDPVWLADKAWRDEVAAQIAKRKYESWLFLWLINALGLWGTKMRWRQYQLPYFRD